LNQADYSGWTIGPFLFLLGRHSSPATLDRSNLAIGTDREIVERTQCRFVLIVKSYASRHLKVSFLRPFEAMTKVFPGVSMCPPIEQGVFPGVSMCPPIEQGDCQIRKLVCGIVREVSVPVGGQNLLDDIIVCAVVPAGLDRVVALCALICGNNLHRKFAAEVYQLAILKGGMALYHFLRQVIQKSPLNGSDHQKLGQSDQPISDRICERRRILFTVDAKDRAATSPHVVLNILL
jgi:hypothetical protein